MSKNTPKKELKKRNCVECDVVFKRTREWQLFCSRKCRSVYHNKNKSKCFYCGDDANCRDHVVPTYARSVNIRSYSSQETVPCCGDCNGMLGKWEDDTFRDRILRLMKKHRKKYDLRSDDEPPKWSLEELDELGPSLRTRIMSKIRSRLVEEARLIYMMDVMFWWNRTQKK